MLLQYERCSTRYFFHTSIGLLREVRIPYLDYLERHLSLALYFIPLVLGGCPQKRTLSFLSIFQIPNLLSFAKYLLDIQIELLRDKCRMAPSSRDKFRALALFVRQVSRGYLARYTAYTSVGFCMRGTDSVPRLVFCVRYVFHTSVGFLREVRIPYLDYCYRSSSSEIMCCTHILVLSNKGIRCIIKV